MMLKNQILKNVYFIKFSEKSEAAKTFLRFQEYYESPQFKGKIFTLKEYIKWYKTKSGDGTFSYYEDWSGFNIPGYILEPFYNGEFKFLSKREKELLELFKDKKEKFYIIACAEADEATLMHKKMHGLYYTNEKYRNKVKEILSKIDCSDIHQMLADYGYHKDVFVDETHAYLCTRSTRG